MLVPQISHPCDLSTENRGLKGISKPKIHLGRLPALETDKDNLIINDEWDSKKLHQNS